MFTRVQLLSSVILGVSLVLCCIVTKYIIGETNLAFRACGELSQALQGQVSYLKHSAYATSLQSHYSNQAAELSPACIIRPKTSQDVSILVKTLSSLNRSGNNAYRFAIRSGGHTPWAGSASIHNGVTIDLSALSNVVVGPDSSIASIGPGARWENVYRELDVLKLTVPGGRSGGVGVGGYLLGGGISFHAPRMGFACDNVVNFEVVLADGQIVHVNQSSYPDLWVALKGGSNNFGIVTRYDLRTITQGELWGGVVLYPGSTVTDQLAAFVNFNVASGYDEYAAVIMSVGFSPATGTIVLNNLEYTSPVVNPPVFRPFTDIQPQIYSTVRITNMTDLAVEIGSLSGRGSRDLFITTTFHNDLSMMTTIYEMFSASTAHITSVTNITYSISFQPIPPAITSKSAPLGGNSLGLDPSAGPLVLVLLAVSWPLPLDDALVTTTAEKLFADIDQASQSRGLFHKWKYLNYASNTQDPISGYGPQNMANLRALSRKYDPHGLFQLAVPGGFKVLTADDYVQSDQSPL